ncbi:HAD family hydrolase [Allostreptomyces psammosilenae]|uniref:Phosphoglycolate phosphatase n=1 Tax=Allostreptomyces psammosilenae TaxID=1892865 RepID=A0A852ZZW8_9ACTN|nr:haloacid dehalogenase-like hydrolase [Allostreptomyces psammosilenae]NYI07665.1 phosphoglycolate phosphatase [Allostreptomyces psammosilenae]
MASPHASVPAAPEPTAGSPVAPTVGFDLDMTLIDSRPGVKAVYDRLAEESGRFIDSALAVTRLGPPLEVELAHWFPQDEIQQAGDRFRALYPDYAIEPSPAMPGALEAVEAVRAAGGRPIVVTGKFQPNAVLHLKHLGIEVDEVYGWLWADAKGEALREQNATVYVGDHIGDIRGAQAAGAVSVAVPSGPISADELAAAGADVVLPDLTAFGDWFADYAARAR